MHLAYFGSHDKGVTLRALEAMRKLISILSRIELSVQEHTSLIPDEEKYRFQSVTHSSLQPQPALYMFLYSLFELSDYMLKAGSQGRHPFTPTRSLPCPDVCLYSVGSPNARGIAANCA